MFARYQDPENQENNQQELELSLDLYTCPMTRQIIRHPVLTSDGHRYELQYLLRYVMAGNVDSPLRAGLGGIYPVVYDPDWKQMLDDLLHNHPDRYEDYNIEGMVDQINDKLQDLMPTEAEVIDNGAPIHVAIGNSVFKMIFFYAIFSYCAASIISQFLPERDRDNDVLSRSFVLTAFITMLASLVYHESRIRIENNNEHGILGGIANQYYSLFKRPSPPRRPQAPQADQWEPVQFQRIG